MGINPFAELNACIKKNIELGIVVWTLIIFFVVQLWSSDV